MIDPVDRTLFGVCRLRIPSQIFTGEHHFIPELDGAALIRELHVFGDQVPVGKNPVSPIPNRMNPPVPHRHSVTSPLSWGNSEYLMLSPPLAGEVPAEREEGFLPKLDTNWCTER